MIFFRLEETPDESSLNSFDRTLEKTSFNDEEKKFDQDFSHHPLTLLSFLSQNGDETNVRPIGKRPNRALPAILYRPRRILDIEYANANAEKTRKDLEKVYTFHRENFSEKIFGDFRKMLTKINK